MQPGPGYSAIEEITTSVNPPRELLPQKPAAHTGPLEPVKLCDPMMEAENRSREFQCLDASRPEAVSSELQTPVKRPRASPAATVPRPHMRPPPCSRALDLSSPVHGECRGGVQDPFEDPRLTGSKEFGGISDLVGPLFSSSAKHGVNQNVDCSEPEIKNVLPKRSFSSPLSLSYDKAGLDKLIEETSLKKRTFLPPLSARQCYSEDDSLYVSNNHVDGTMQSPNHNLDKNIELDLPNVFYEQLQSSLSDMTPMGVAEVIEDLLRQQLHSTLCLQTALQRLTNACIEAQERFQSQFALLSELNSAMCSRSLAPALQVLVQHARDTMPKHEPSVVEGRQSHKRARTEGDDDIDHSLT